MTNIVFVKTNLTCFSAYILIGFIKRMLPTAYSITTFCTVR